MEIKPFTAPSSDGIHTLAGKVYLPSNDPDTPPRGIFHIVHGMTEHIARYDTFMQTMAADGWLVCGYDHLGHGYTARDTSELGYIAPKDGWKRLVDDVRIFSDAVRNTYGRNLPYVLMGHSMGSFIVRLATERCVTPDRLIIMGTGGPNPAAGAGLALIGLIKTFRGDHHISSLIDAVAFGSYNDRFGGKSPDADPHAWLTTDVSVRDRYRVDPFCTFKFTVSAMGDLIHLTKYANRGKWYTSIPKRLPVLLVAGEDDPVGNYGKGVRTVHDRLTRAGIPTACHLYPGARHEILNDTCRDDVLRDIRTFLEDIE